MAYKLSKEEITKEIIKCGRDPAYFLDNYAKIVHQSKGLIPFRTFKFQKDLLNDFHDHRYNVILKSRQMGISTIVAGYAAWMLLFHKERNILVMATKLNTAIEIVEKVKDIIDSVPAWVKIAEVSVNNKTKLELTNGSKIHGVPTSKDAGRSQALSLLIIDEAAFVDDMDDLWTGLVPTVSTGGRCIALSTPNGVGNWFHKTYVESESGQNNFKPSKLPWHIHPDYTPEWFDDMTRNMSKRQIAQEFECVTGDTRIVTKNGFKTIRDLQIGDEVLTHQGRFRKIINKKNKIVHKDEMCKISMPYSRTNPLFITNNHPLLTATKRNKTTNRIQNIVKENSNIVEWKNLQDLQEEFGKYVVPQYMNMLFPEVKREILTNKINILDLSLENITKEYDKETVRYHRQEGSNKRFINVDKAFGKLCGLFITEGNYISSGGIQLSFHSEEVELINFVKEFCGTYSFRFSVHPRKDSKCTVILIYNKFLTSILKKFINGDKCYNKIFTNIIFDTNKDFIYGLIAGMWLGDGLHKPKEKNIISLANEELIYQLRILMFYSGLITRVSSKFNNVNDIRTQYLLELNNVNNKGIEEILEQGIDINNVIGSRSIKNEDGWWGRITNIVESPQELDDEVEVFNIEVDEDNSYICENIVVHNCNFNASGETVMNPEDIMRIKKDICEPKYRTWMDRNYHIWKEYQPDGSYLLSADVARGDGKDYSVFHILDVKGMEQIAEYQGKIDIDSFARLLFDAGREYGNCMIVVENNNVGFAVLTKLIEMRYPNLYYSAKGSQDFVDSLHAQYTSNTVPGFTTTMKTRPLIVAKLEEFIRNKSIKINSQRAIHELDTFVWVNGRPEAQKSYNDDLVMSLAIGCWVRDTAIVNNERNLEYSKAFLSAITKTGNYLDTSARQFQNEDRSRKQQQIQKLYTDFDWIIKG